MGKDFWDRLWPFNDEPKPTPPDDDEPEPAPLPIDPHTPPAPEPPDVPDIPGPPPISASRPDRLFVDGEEVDSAFDPATGIVAKTVLSKVVTRRGRQHVLKLVVLAEPLADPADRAKLKDALSRPGPHASLLGAHQVFVVAWPYTIETMLMSAPMVRQVGEGIQVHKESNAANRKHLKLYFYGDAPMRVEIDIPWNVTSRPIPEWAWTVFKIDHSFNRLPHGQNEKEYSTKEVVVE